MHAGLCTCAAVAAETDRLLGPPVILVNDENSEEGGVGMWKNRELNHMTDGSQRGFPSSDLWYKIIFDDCEKKRKGEKLHLLGALFNARQQQQKSCARICMYYKEVVEVHWMKHRIGKPLAHATAAVHLCISQTAFLDGKSASHMQCSDASSYVHDAYISNSWLLSHSYLFSFSFSVHVFYCLRTDGLLFAALCRAQSCTQME
jgi:hypothetical protein